MEALGGGFSEMGDGGGGGGSRSEFPKSESSIYLEERGRGWDYRTLSDRTDRHAIAFKLSDREIGTRDPHTQDRHHIAYNLSDREIL